jgi:hypothetical protein
MLGYLLTGFACMAIAFAIGTVAGPYLLTLLFRDELDEQLEPQQETQRRGTL